MVDTPAQDAPPDHGAESKVVIYAAFAGNLAIAVSKFAAFAFTGSTALLTEAIHSVVDTGNQALLLLGLRRAKRPPDAGHPFGHGMELYFWAFVVALMVFTVGGVLSIYEGLQRLRHPEEMTSPWINFLVLGLAILFEGSSFAVALRQQRRRWPGIRLIPFLRMSKDPSLFAVLIEDAAAMAGLVIALVGVTVATVFHLPAADGVASILIGLLLIFVALFMANETRSLLTGEAASPTVVANLRRVLDGDPCIAEVVEILTMHLGPEEILAGVTVDFRDTLSAGDLERAVDRMIAALQQAEPRVTRVFLRPGKPAPPISA